MKAVCWHEKGDLYMQVKMLLHEKYKELEIHVCHCEMNEQVRTVAEQISGLFQESVRVSDENGVKMLALHEIIRFYAEGQRVLVQTASGTYQTNSKLYELEEQLPASQFIRISRGEIVNLRQIRQLDMSLTGTIKVILRDETQTYTSRRCIPQLKKALGVGKERGV